MCKASRLLARICPICEQITLHETLYAKTHSGGRTKWFQLYWACVKCGSLSHVVLPIYRLHKASYQLPSAMARGVVEALREGPLDIDELIACLTSKSFPREHHGLNSSMAAVLKYLKRCGVVSEEVSDSTEKSVNALLARPEASMHLGACPAELMVGVEKKRMISLYAERILRIARTPKSPAVFQKRLVPIGVLCLRCGYCELCHDGGRARKDSHGGDARVLSLISEASTSAVSDGADE